MEKTPSTDLLLADLLVSACPSIQYRLRAELLGQSPCSPEMLSLQQQILNDPLVQEVLSWQLPDGWLGWDFHGKKSTETGIRILCEKGVYREHPALQQALQALEAHPERLERGLGTAGNILDELGFGGTQMIQAAVFSYAGMEEKSFVKEQVQEALGGFRFALDIHSIKEIVEEFKGRLVFQPGVRWPSIYHLRLLAFTHGWRNKENRAMLKEAIQRLVGLSPLPEIYVRNKSRWIAPACFAMQDFNPNLVSLDDANWLKWFHRMECLARLGMIQAVPELKRQAEYLERLLQSGGGRFTRKLNHPYFTRWSAYTGLMLERDWRSPLRRRYDLTFRGLLILYNYEFLNMLPNG